MRHPEWPAVDGLAFACGRTVVVDAIAAQLAESAGPEPVIN